MKFYVEFNENNKVIGISQLTDVVNNPNMTEISEEDFSNGHSFLGKKYKQNKFYGLVIESPKTVQRNEVVNIDLKWFDMEGILVDDITTITVTIGGIQEQVVAVNGVIGIEFSSEELGEFEIVAVCTDGCRAMEIIEVI